jgi:hypothetical protein
MYIPHPLMGAIYGSTRVLVLRRVNGVLSTRLNQFLVTTGSEDLQASEMMFVFLHETEREPDVEFSGVYPSITHVSCL